MNVTQTDSAMGKDDFLRLFTAQLKNQDPLSPMDSAAFTAQLAQFSSLEQLYNVNDKLSELLESQDALSNAAGVNLLGKEVILEGGATGTVVGVGFNGGRAEIVLDNGDTFDMSDIRGVYDI